MNRYRHRSAIIAVGLVVTMSAGAALAADTGLTPGFVKTSLSSPSTDDTTTAAYDTIKLSSTLESGGSAAVAQALRQSDAVGVAAGAGSASTLREALADDDLASAGFSGSNGGSSLVALANLSQEATGTATVGRETLGYSGFGTGSASYAGRGRLTDENGLLASHRESGTPSIDLPQLAAALTSGSNESINVVVDSIGFPKIGREEPDPLNPNLDPSIQVSPSDPSFPVPPVGPPRNAMMSSDLSGARSATLADALTGGTSVERATLANSGFGTGYSPYSRRGRLTDESGLLASARGSGSSGIELAHVADALTGGDSVGRQTLAYSGYGPSYGSYGGRRLTDESGVSASFGNDLLTSGASYAAPDQDNGAYGAAAANTRESGSPTLGLSQLSGSLTSDRSDAASFAAGPMDNGSMLQAGIAAATTSNAVYSSVLSEASSIDAGLAGALTDN